MLDAVTGATFLCGACADAAAACVLSTGAALAAGAGFALVDPFLCGSAGLAEAGALGAAGGARLPFRGGGAAARTTALRTVGGVLCCFLVMASSEVVQGLNFKTTNPSILIA